MSSPVRCSCFLCLSKILRSRSWLRGLFLFDCLIIYLIFIDLFVSLFVSSFVCFIVYLLVDISFILNYFDCTTKQYTYSVYSASLQCQYTLESIANTISIIFIKFNQFTCDVSFCINYL